MNTALSPLIPRGPSWTIPWDSIAASPFGPLLEQMRETPQDPRYHGEGNVLLHTRMVCQELVDLEEFRCLPRQRQEILFLAALLHDTGKITKTRLEDGRWRSPNHAPAGAQVIRDFLWTTFSLAGTPEKQQLRESICALIRNHGVPAHALDYPEPERRLLQIQSANALLPDFDLDLLCLLSLADARGRICQDRKDMEEQVLLCREFSRELLAEALPFPSDFTRYARLTGRNVPPGMDLYDDTWGEILLMCGLPGTGKDTWLARNFPELPQVSLDRIRAEHGLSSTGNQHPVADLGMEQARQYLRAHRAFVWNATTITPDLRRKVVQLCENYGARVRIVYLETDPVENLRRNRNRPTSVPEQVIHRMRHGLTPPEIFEAHRVEWICL